MFNGQNHVNNSPHKLPLFSTPVSRPSRKKKKQLNTLKCEVKLFSQLYIGCQTRDGNLEEFFQHENQVCPPSLSTSGKLHLVISIYVTYIVIGGATVVQMLESGAAKTFEEYAHHVFLPYISGQFEHVSHLDLAWDSYVVDTHKATAREKHGKGARRRVAESAPIPGNWQDFLRVDINKEELFSFLSKTLNDSFKLD